MKLGSCRAQNQTNKQTIVNVSTPKAKAVALSSDNRMANQFVSSVKEIEIVSDWAKLGLSEPSLKYHSYCSSIFLTTTTYRTAVYIMAFMEQAVLLMCSRVMLQ